MTLEQRHTLLWLTNAMTLPVSYRIERYFYDIVNQSFFARLQMNNCDTCFTFKDHLGNKLNKDIAADILVRLELINDNLSEIVEIPKLNVQDKIAIQSVFVSHFPSVCAEQELLRAINKQLDDFCFVLDKVLANPNYELTAPMAAYWDGYKLKTVMEHLNAFTSAIEVNLMFS